jgi:hypothetical protein
MHDEPEVPLGGDVRRQSVDVVQLKGQRALRES